MTAAVEIVIDELVVRGVDPVHAPVLTHALQRRLAHLASEGPVDWSPQERDVLLARRVRAPAASPAELGRLIADSVWSSVTGSGRTAP
jgi:hypothetical protein